MRDIAAKSEIPPKRRKGAAAAAANENTNEFVRKPWWWNPELTRLVEERDIAKRNFYESNRSPVKREIYNKAKVTFQQREHRRAMNTFWEEYANRIDFNDFSFRCSVWILTELAA